MPRSGCESVQEVGGGTFSTSDKLYQKNGYKMFCSLLSTFQMSCKSTPCQWSAHVPLLTFRQLSAQLSPGYRDSKFSPCLCCLSPKSLSAPGLRDFISQLLHETYPVCSPQVRIVWPFSTPHPCRVLLFCLLWGDTITSTSDYQRLCFGGCLVGQMHAKQRVVALPSKPFPG